MIPKNMGGSLIGMDANDLAKAKKDPNIWRIICREGIERLLRHVGGQTKSLQIILLALGRMVFVELMVRNSISMLILSQKLPGCLTRVGKFIIILRSTKWRKLKDFKDES